VVRHSPRVTRTRCLQQPPKWPRGWFSFHSSRSLGLILTPQELRCSRCIFTGVTGKRAGPPYWKDKRADWVCLNFREIAEFKRRDLKENLLITWLSDSPAGQRAGSGGREQHHTSHRESHRLELSHGFQIFRMRTVSMDTKFLLLSPLQ